MGSTARLVAREGRCGAGRPRWSAWGSCDAIPHLRLVSPLRCALRALEPREPTRYCVAALAVEPAGGWSWPPGDWSFPPPVVVPPVPPPVVPGACVVPVGFGGFGGCGPTSRISS